jgi:3-oxoacyl-[acyl-carrier protein] reductase
MLLEGKNAVVYGGGGKVGGAVARAFASGGARVFLAGRTLATLQEVAEDIASAGGVAETAQVDALDEQVVEKHIGEVMERAGSVDVSFNAISIQDVQLTPLLEMSREDFMRPIHTGTATHFLTARAAARRMATQGSGVILTFSASSVRAFFPGVYVGGFGIACTAIEALTKQLAAEVGPEGIRVN